MFMEHTESSAILPDQLPPLPEVPGGWRRACIELNWTKLELAVPFDPDALLDTEEVLEANRRDDSMPYWATLWPAAEVMARLLDQTAWPAGLEILEIGCGLGLVGIAGLRKGWRVHMTDGDPSSLAATKFNAALNGFPSAKISLLDWRRPPKQSYSVILACDVLYEVRHHRPILDLLDDMLTGDGCCWIGDPGRTPIVEFYNQAIERQFKVVIRDTNGETCNYPVRGQFQILELTRQTSQA